MRSTWLLIGAFTLGFVAARGQILRPAGAAPTDVHGALGVAVTGYKTSKGSYLLWTDGHITSATTGQPVIAGVSTAGSYLAAPGVTASTMPAGAMVGSPYVAVGVLPIGSNTDVVFSNGAVMKPNDAGASAGSASGGVRFVHGPTVTRTAGPTTTYCSSGDISLSPDGLTATFDPPFTNSPLVYVINPAPVTSNVNGIAVSCMQEATSTSCPIPGGAEWVIAIGN